MSRMFSVWPPVGDIDSLSILDKFLVRICSCTMTLGAKRSCQRAVKVLQLLCPRTLENMSDSLSGSALQTSQPVWQGFYTFFTPIGQTPTRSRDTLATHHTCCRVGR